MGAYGVRGRYRVVETIPDDEVPIGCTWFYEKHQELMRMGFARCRIKVWSDIRGLYMMF